MCAAAASGDPVAPPRRAGAENVTLHTEEAPDPDFSQSTVPTVDSAFSEAATSSADEATDSAVVSFPANTRKNCPEVSPLAEMVCTSSNVALDVRALAANGCVPAEKAVTSVNAPSWESPVGLLDTGHVTTYLN